jgi:hypothetical protein
MHSGNVAKLHDLQLGVHGSDDSEEATQMDTPTDSAASTRSENTRVVPSHARPTWPAMAAMLWVLQRFAGGSIRRGILKQIYRLWKRYCVLCIMDADDKEQMRTF